MKHAQTVFKNFLKHDCFYLASHISFCALLSLIPLILIAISIVGFLLGSSQEVYQQLLSAIASLLPRGKELLTSNLNQVVGQHHSMGILGVVILTFIATLLFGAIERALDVIFEAEKSRNFFHSRLLAIVLIGVISLFFFLPTAADLLTRALTRFGFHFPLGEILRGKPFYFLFSTFAFVFIIVVIPHHRVRLRYAVFGGLFFAAVILLAKQWFRWYFLRAFDQYNLIYGSLTALVLLLLWIYYVSNILLLSAEIVAHLQLRRLRPTSNLRSGALKFLGRRSV
ncbi:MAG: hypothetical protein A3F82_07810 [Deltaproteobacteria bacterium RIFCSPLOWO2_12_FULL_44_12]|nr:MAG: hypothetical protein A2712_10645 [Deltaproteobacteria bacterium RIFCSPHIGHO2_01_FULL_43_49]OGQ15565.1 MAG: hypothetical protein A3D22_11175 [Deltaproteobacteria bacterium RIFCSPHIGHO2_02_FULL_44_53]OGQ28507.1 MAG: hypothetical protein A3D98_03360 [Deltaproteobacteria bacterium RIFCSPHIGHO2_12_FULL_44_21]OGQ32371.1 MAG: hypothetical protein A2979_01020 [Deltaproteobacteria bacterium RIFCSPLOWO2_01_FULL_45_74]OGQ44013.1 MAG: hypothetical protein A3I70_04920 [Deltaproteobacteria bacterium 